MLKRLATAISFASMLAAAPLAPAEAQEASPTAFDFTLPAIDGGHLELSDWRGRVLLVVNTASFCGYTSQYEGLQKLWTDYQGKGLVVLGIPSNDFLQEPKAESEIQSFCQGAFGVTFPLTAKLTVTGTKAHPLYRWLGSVSGQPKWNFYKYLIGRNGKVIAMLSSRQSPASPEVVSLIEKALNETGNSLKPSQK